MLSVESSFQVDGRRVAAKITLPEHRPIGGAVLVDGSGPGTRNDLDTFAARFIDAGVVALTHDKAGCGETTGDWTSQTFEDRAVETIAALDHLRTHPAVNGAPVGVWGGSQGGWIAPMAAVSDGRTAFVIVQSAAAVSPLEQEQASLRQRMEAAGEGHEAVAAVTEHLDRLVAAADADDWDAVADLEHRVAKQPWASYLHAELSDRTVLRFFARSAHHDPVAVLA